jgi:hypothetical protein
VLIENRIEGNGGGGVTLPAPDRAEEVFAWNTFGGAGRAEAVRITSAVVPAGAATPVTATPTPAPTTTPPRQGSRRHR